MIEGVEVNEERKRSSRLGQEEEQSTKGRRGKDVV